MNNYNFARKRNFFGNLKVNTILVIINVIAFIAIQILLSINPDFLKYIALNPSNILQGKFLWTFLTSMFSHVAFWHLAFNMISLFFVGGLVEKIIGPKRYLFFYIASGLFAGIIFVLFAGFFGASSIGAKLFGDPGIFGVGASGAIFGLVGLLAILIPKKRIYLIAGPLAAIILQTVIQVIFPNNPFSNILDIIVTIYIFISIFLMFSFNSKMKKIILPIEMPFWIIPVAAIVPLVIISLFVPLPIGNSAHFGGLVLGLIYGIYLKSKFPKKTQMISKIFSR